MQQHNVKSVVLTFTVIHVDLFYTTISVCTHVFWPQLDPLTLGNWPQSYCQTRHFGLVFLADASRDITNVPKTQFSALDGNMAAGDKCMLVTVVSLWTNKMMSNFYLEHKINNGLTAVPQYLQATIRIRNAGHSRTGLHGQIPLSQYGQFNIKILI